MPKRMETPRLDLLKDSQVLYFDNHLLVLNKPAGMPVQEDASGDMDALRSAKAWLKQKFAKPGNVFLGLVHRLDRPVSGVMVFARTSKAASRLSEQFRARSPVKKYLAIVEGRCSGEGTRIDYLVKEDEKVRVVREGHAGGQRAELEWKSLDHKQGLSLVELTLKTGRPHQIRLQLSTMGFPILGDFRYGASQELDGRNLALHCYALAIEHPVSKQRMQWMALPPAAWGDRFRPEIQKAVEAFAAQASEAQA